MLKFIQKLTDPDFTNRFIFLMKCSFVMLIVQITFAGVLIAGTARSQNLNDIKVNLNLDHASLKESLLQLQAKSGVKFTLFNQLLEKESKKVVLHSGQISVSDALKNILSGTRLNYKLVNEFVVIQAKPVPPKPGKISGKILDEKGEVLPGASVRIVELNSRVSTGNDGSYLLEAQPGIYTIEVNYIGYQTKRITGITVNEGKSTALTISLKPSSSTLNAVTVTSSYKKASAEGLLARQKNASEISNGISAEQIARTPDKNIGESLKRISGVSSFDNKFVIVRGIGERYNAAMLDGTSLPSTEAQNRSFSFDLIPSNLVDNVVVSKTVTPDQNVSFGGGLIQINTKDIPTENFMSFSMGASYNDQTTGKDFLSHKRGKYDFLGFDDGHRDLPGNLQPYDPALQDRFNPDGQVVQQSKTFKNSSNFVVYKYKAAPSQNYQFSIGRLYDLDTVGTKKFGFTGSVSYRNTQSIEQYTGIRRGSWDQFVDTLKVADPGLNTGAGYGYNTTWGSLLNAGLQLKNHKLTLRNTYTHTFENTMVRMSGYLPDNPANGDATIPKSYKEQDDPIFTDLLQNKISGIHQLGIVKLEWDAARTSVTRNEKDVLIAAQYPTLVDGQTLYYYGAGSATEARVTDMSRSHYKNSERNYTWNIAGSIPFNTGKLRNIFKTGYSGNKRHGLFDYVSVPLVRGVRYPESLLYLPVEQWGDHIGPEGFLYVINGWDISYYEGKSGSHAGFMMFDNRLGDQLRLVWGARAEYYKYTEIHNVGNIKGSSTFKAPKDKEWQWMPSANLTYSPVSDMNLRAAWSRTVVRPELMDNSQFWRYMQKLGGMYGSAGIKSTAITSYDLKAEWFPGAGEIVSVNGFYKRFADPAELYASVNSNYYYTLRNSQSAEVYGLEIELRKNLNFFGGPLWLKDFTLFGNLTLQKSDVIGMKYGDEVDENGKLIFVQVKEKRPLYGQSPYLINAGLQYIGKHAGFNIVYNKNGKKTYLISDDEALVETEQPREQVDIQLSYRVYQNKLEFKLNAGNVFDKKLINYNNKRGYGGSPIVNFIQSYGRTYSLSANYNF